MLLYQIIILMIQITGYLEVTMVDHIIYAIDAFISSASQCHECIHSSVWVFPGGNRTLNPGIISAMLVPCRLTTLSLDMDSVSLRDSSQSSST